MTLMPLYVSCSRPMFLTFYAIPVMQKRILRLCIGGNNPLGSQTLDIFNIIDNNAVYSRCSSRQFVSTDNFLKGDISHIKKSHLLFYK